MKNIKRFKKVVYDHYHSHGRHDLPWRHAERAKSRAQRGGKTFDPYKILVSEIMLQQTQVDRVVNYYEKFIRAFPTVQSLAHAPLKKVLRVWSGLGYNRRALMLHRCAQEIVKKHRGRIPHEIEVLITLPGIGPYTAGAVRAFAFNRPAIVLDTNIRSVYIHWFFPGVKDSPSAEGLSLNRLNNIHDKDIISLIEKTMDRKNPRKWYSALMDYGAWLKAQGENPSRRSAHHTRQSKFEGSHRQVRGKALKLLNQGPHSMQNIVKELRVTSVQVKKALKELEEEGFVRIVGEEYKIA